MSDAQAAESSAKWTTDVFGLDTAPVPTSGCTSPEYFHKELEHIFRRTWIPVGREAEIPRRGDYLVHQIDALKTSVLVVRGRDMKVRAFHNVCSHRCNKVMNDARGSCGALYCRYHGWMYDLEGRLVRIPDESEFFGVDKSDHGLTPVALEIWQGFVFINLDPQPDQSLPEYMAEIYDGLDGYPFDEMTHCIAWRIQVNCNWKLLKDAFCEIYHLPFMHAKSASYGFVSEDQPVPRALDLMVHDNGAQFSISGNHAAKYPPMPTVAFRYGTAIHKSTETMTLAGPKPRLLNPTGSSTWIGEMIQLFPSLQLSIFPQSYLYHSFMPISESTCMWDFRMYMRPPEDFGMRFSQEYAAVQARDTILEDIPTVEATQSVLSGGGKTHFQFSDQEMLVRMNHLMTQRFAGPYPV